MPLPNETVPEAIKGSVATVLAAVSALTLDRWVMIGTLVYLCIQGVYLLRKWFREEKDWDRKARS
jgi:predicted transporter